MPPLWSVLIHRYQLRSSSFLVSIMRYQLLYPAVIAAALGRLAQSKAVFAHYMLGNIKEEHAHQDVDDAIAMGLDGFALNVGDATQAWVGPSLNYLFGYAQYRGFKLYISMDVYAAGDSCFRGGHSCNGPYDYRYIFDAWLGSSAYYRIDNKPLISTFSSGGFSNNNWTDWRASLGRDIFFMPDIDETRGYYESGNTVWWDYWGHVLDGMFSWETAWPARGGVGGLYPGDVSVDVSVLRAAHDHGKRYMIGVSPLQYKDSYGTNIYRVGDLNLPTRMANILNMNPAPDFVQFQTWNDGPESHYIGTLWPEQNTDSEPSAYANEAHWSHTAWQPLVKSFIDAYKNRKSPSSMDVEHGGIVGAAWYKTILPNTITCPYDGSSKYYSAPEGFKDGENYLYYSVVIGQQAPTGYKLDINAGGKTTTISLNRGLNMGSSGIDITSGAQCIELKDPSGAIVMSATGGMCVSSGCPSLIYNSNYQVLPLKSGPQAATCTGWDLRTI
ncbi:glycoside hydrolase [Trichoderma barbatum]